MRLFRRATRHPDPGADLRRTVSSVVLLDEAGGGTREDRRAQLLRIVAEAVVLQDQAEAVLADIRALAPLADVAPRGGPLARRFLVLAQRLPSPVGADMARQCNTAAVVLDHHGYVLTYALELLAADPRSPRVREQLERLAGLGTPAARLDALYAELASTGRAGAPPR